jgi:hypothetical protein
VGPWKEFVFNEQDAQESVNNVEVSGWRINDGILSELECSIETSPKPKKEKGISP